MENEMPDNLQRPEPTAFESAALEPFALTIKQVQLVEDCTRTAVYERLGRGEYVAVKDGKRIRVLMSSIRRRRESLPLAKIKAPAPRRKKLPDNTAA
jgi:hypothetical protein